MVMSVSRARLVVVVDQSSGRSIIALLIRMGLGSVQTVHSLVEARRLCEAAEADACLVVLPAALPDEAPQAMAQAPGSAVGIPSLLLVEVITPYLAKSARDAGYAAVGRLRMPPRLLYRCIGGLLQKGRRSGDMARRRRAANWLRQPNAVLPQRARGTADWCKPKLQ